MGRHHNTRISVYLWKSGSNHNPLDYPCRDTATGALRPVPPGSTRADAFCPRCHAERCILDRNANRYSARPGRTDNNAAYLARCRSDGITSAGRPLARRCWNCVHLRRVRDRGVELFVCAWRHGNSPRDVMLRNARSRKTMLCRQPTVPVYGCGGTAFALRPGPIEEWDVNA